MRDGSARLDIPSFDFAPFAEAEKRVTEAGLQIRTYPELAEDSDRDAKICELGNAVLADVPPRGERTPLTIEQYIRTRLRRPGKLPDAMFFAVAPDGEYVGMTELSCSDSGDPAILAVGLTGVRAPWRKQGIALALNARPGYVRNP